MVRPGGAASSSGIPAKSRFPKRGCQDFPPIQDSTQRLWRKHGARQTSGSLDFDIEDKRGKSVQFYRKPVSGFLSIACFSLVTAFSAQQSAPAAAAAQTLTFPTVLYGVAYYHEYIAEDRLDKDIALMKAAGLNVVRMGESTWSLWEPEDGRFEYAWMDRVVDAMGKAGIKVILGTPTYSIPAWMAHQHP